MPESRQRALLVTVFRNDLISRELATDHLEELSLLSDTYGVDTADMILLPCRKFVAATLLTSGKLEELVARVQEIKPDVVIFDDEISPAQQRNLEKVLGVPVIDRTEVILAVFADRAHTREAKLQVELARVQYQLPRLKRLWTHLGRQSGSSGSGGAHQKGEGEQQIEIDRRIIKQRVTALQKDIEDLAAHRQTVRSSRQKSHLPILGLVGYTNAGKSTLLNALTGADAFVEDKLFATLDTTTRKLTLANNQEMLLVDTVGFIRKLPHQLVAAFRSTLEEATFADILLHVVDVSHPAAAEQADTTIEVLKQLNAADKPIITVLNKIDCCKDLQMAARIRLKFPHTVQISALTRQGFAELEEMMLEELKKRRTTVKLRIPQKDYGIVSEVLRQGNLLQQEYEENDILIQIELPASVAQRLARYEQK